MGTTRESSPPTDAGELDRLRRRAYGPDADIESDPDALARLIELESARWHHPLMTDTTVAVAPDVAEPDPVDADQCAVDVATPPAPRHRRVVLIVAAAAVALIVGAFGSIVVGGVSEFRLYRQMDISPLAAAQLSDVGQLGYMGIESADVRLYDEYRGLYVWSAPRGADTTCMFVTSAIPPRWRVDCTPRDGTPVIDLLQYREDSRLAGMEALGDVPVGHVLRLVLREGAVDVRVVKAPSATIDQ